jgi:hypothetical protein
MYDGNDTSNRQPCTTSENGAESENYGTGIHDDNCNSSARTQTQHEKMITENQKITI